MPSSRAGLGRRGEQLAAEHLQQRGYRLLARNVRTPSAEIDLVAMDGEELALVEVRTRRGRAFGTAAESITAAKQAKLRLAAAEYSQLHPELPAAYRIDVVVVELDASGRLIGIEMMQSAVGEE